jgi:hypothetical protein
MARCVSFFFHAGDESAFVLSAITRPSNACEYPAGNHPISPGVGYDRGSYDASVSSWVVLLLGGASGVGKSTMSHRLARRLGVNLTEIDDIQIALETATGPEHLPLLHYWRTSFDEYMSWTDERRVEHHVRVCREVFQPVMRAIIAEHLQTGTRVVYEGDWLLPEMATMTAYGNEPNGGRVRALFVSEPDEAQIAANYGAREGGAQRASSLFKAFIRAECGRHGVPVVDARPLGQRGGARAHRSDVSTPGGRTSQHACRGQCDGSFGVLPRSSRRWLAGICSHLRVADHSARYRARSVSCTASPRRSRRSATTSASRSIAATVDAVTEPQVAGTSTLLSTIDGRSRGRSAIQPRQRR